MDTENPHNPQESKSDRLPRHIHKWGPTFGVGTLLVMFISVLLVAIANYWLVQRANQQIADLLVRLGAAQEHITQMEAQQGKTEADLNNIIARETKTNLELDKMDSLIKQLESVDPKRLTDILDVVSKPQADLLLRADAMADHLHIVEALVARIYQAAYWAHDQQYRDNPQVLRNILSETWAADMMIRYLLDPSDKNFGAIGTRITGDVVEKLVMEKLKQRNPERSQPLDFGKDVTQILSTGLRGWRQGIDAQQPSTQPHEP